MGSVEITIFYKGLWSYYSSSLNSTFEYKIEEATAPALIPGPLATGNITVRGPYLGFIVRRQAALVMADRSLCRVVFGADIDAFTCVLFQQPIEPASWLSIQLRDGASFSAPIQMPPYPRIDKCLIDTILPT